MPQADAGWVSRRARPSPRLDQKALGPAVPKPRPQVLKRACLDSHLRGNDGVGGAVHREALATSLWHGPTGHVQTDVEGEAARDPPRYRVCPAVATQARCI